MKGIFESWLMQAAAEGLPGWKRALLKLALGLDRDLRATALDLAAFLREESPKPALAPEQAKELLSRVLASVQGQLSDEKFGLVRVERPQRAVRPGFAFAAAGLALALVVAYLMLLPSGDRLSGGPVQGTVKAALPTPEPVLPTPTATTTPGEAAKK